MRSLSLALLLVACAAPPRPAVSPAAPAPPAATAPATGPQATPPAPGPCLPEALVRLERHLPGRDPGMSLFVTSVDAPGRRRGAVLLMHGAGSAASAVWDLRYKDYSVLRALACAGFDAYTLDVRGFGGSTPPAAMVTGAPDRGAPAARAAEVMPDLEVAMDFIRRRSGVDRVDLVGWSWGCVVAGMFAGQHPEAVRRLFLYAPVFDRKNPRRHRSRGAWYPVERQLFLRYYDPDREELGALKAHVAELFRFTEGDRLRLPAGPYRDIYGPDAPIWSPERVCAPTLVLRGSDDKASTRAAALALFDRLQRAPSRRYVELSGAGHFAFRTLAAPRFRAQLLGFLRGPAPAPSCPARAP